MSQQLQITGGAKVRDLQDVIIGTSGVLSSLAFNVANGVPKLDVNGKILVSQLPNSVMEYQGTWNAATNTPTLVNGTGNQGDVYLCNVAGTTNFGAGPITFAVGDSAIYSGTIWQRAGGATGTVTSVGLTSTGNDAITITGSPITTSGNINLGFAGTNLQYINGAGDLTTFPTLISSIGLSMPSAFSVANSPLTSNGTIAVTGAGYPSQYIRGDGTLADFPTSGGGGSSVSYYLNGGTSQGTIGGVTYYEMSKIAVIGTGVDFPKTGDGLIVSFLTDAGDPAQLNIPAGNWNYEIYASMSANGGTPELYAELYVYDGTTFTLIGTSSNEILYDGTTLNLYTFAMAVPATTLAITDRLAVKLYATNSGGKTTTVHTQDGHLCQIITTFSTGITALNGLTAQVQFFATGTSGTDFAINSSTATHTFNLPVASAANTGKLSSTDWSTFNGKVPYTGATASVNLGNNLLSSASIQLNGDNTSNFGYLGFKQYAGGSSGFNGYTSIFAQGTNSINIAFSATGGSKTISFLSDLISSSTTRSYSLPDADGTIALTSSLSSYLPLAGGTLTGALNGTSAVFSSTVQASAYRLTGMTGGSGALYWTSDRVTLANYNATGVVNIEANGGTSVATFGGATYNNDFVGTLRNTTSAYFATASGNVGIGNSSPSYTLDVSGTGRFTSTLLVSGASTLTGNVGIGTSSSNGNLQFATAVNTRKIVLFEGGNNDYQFYGFGVESNKLIYSTNGTADDHVFFAAASSTTRNELMRIKGSGNVGIGSTSNVGKLDINTGGNTNIVISNDSADTGYNIVSLNGTRTKGSYAGIAGGGSADNNLYLNSGVGVIIQTGASFTARMRINSSGGVNIGTSTWTNGLSTANLDMNSVGLFGYSDQLYFFNNTYHNGSTGFYYKYTGSGVGGIVVENAGNITFVTAPSGTANNLVTLSTRMLITQAGIVMIGNTTYNSAIKGTLINPDGYAYFTADGNNVMFLNRLTSDGNILQFQKNTSVVGSISTNTYSLPSDLNFKKNINTLDLGLNLITKLRAVSYNHKIDDDDAALSTGFIAQEMEQSLIELGVNKNEYYILQHKPNEDETQSQYWLDYTKIIPILTKAIQELNQQNQDLKSRLDKAGL